MIVVRVLAVTVGVLLLVVTLLSSVKTVILPRSVPSLITRAVFLFMRRVFQVIAHRKMSYARRDRILAWYAPMSLIGTLIAWLALVMAAYTLIFWGTDRLTWVESFEMSGSALFTLGTTRPTNLASNALVFTEAAIGLFLLALLITFLPSIYTAFSRRELGVTALAVRAGEPPSGVEMMQRYWVLERMEQLNDVWTEWERWFVDVEETHTSLSSLAFFRSPQADHSWVTAAGAVLDGAALSLSTVDMDRDVQAEFCLRAGYLCLRRIAGFFRVPYDPDPEPDDPISITREEWEEAVAALELAGVPIKADRDRAWRDFAGWRVNYDTVLLALANLTNAPPALWSSDRSGIGTLKVRMLRPTVPR